MPRPLIDPSERQDFLFQVWHGAEALRSDRLTANLVPFSHGGETVALTDLVPGPESFRTLTCETTAGPITARALGVRFLPPSPGGRRLPDHVPVFDAVFAIDESNLRDTIATVRGVLVGA